MERWQKNLGLGIIASIVGTITLEAIHEAVVDWRQEKERERLRAIREEESRQLNKSYEEFWTRVHEITHKNEE